MKERISQINRSIEEKQNRLKEKAERYFASIVIPSDDTLRQGNSTSKNESAPPISYVLYGISALSAIGALTSASKVLCLGVAAASAFGGYKLSKRVNLSGDKDAINTTNANVDSIKNEVTSKVIDSIKKITQEWDDFMELKQCEIQSTIANSNLNDNEKDILSSKVFIYEIIDISLSEASSMINKSVDAPEIKQKLLAYKEKVKSAIDNAAHKQISKYNSLILYADINS